MVLDIGNGINFVEKSFTELKKKRNLDKNLFRLLNIITNTLLWVSYKFFNILRILCIFELLTFS